MLPAGHRLIHARRRISAGKCRARAPNSLDFQATALGLLPPKLEDPLRSRWPQYPGMLLIWWLGDSRSAATEFLCVTMRGLRSLDGRDNEHRPPNMGWSYEPVRDYLGAYAGTHEPMIGTLGEDHSVIATRTEGETRADSAPAHPALEAIYRGSPGCQAIAVISASARKPSNRPDRWADST